MPVLEISTAGIKGIQALRHLVLATGHHDRLAGLQAVQGEVDGTAAVMARALPRIDDEYLLVGGGPERAQQVWSYDSHDGRALPILVVIDEYTQETVGCCW
jgi:hypothetical protein